MKNNFFVKQLTVKKLLIEELCVGIGFLVGYEKNCF